MHSLCFIVGFFVFCLFKFLLQCLVCTDGQAVTNAFSKSIKWTVGIQKRLNVHMSRAWIHLLKAMFSLPTHLFHINEKQNVIIFCPQKTALCFFCSLLLHWYYKDANFHPSLFTLHPIIPSSPDSSTVQLSASSQSNAYNQLCQPCYWELTVSFLQPSNSSILNACIKLVSCSSYSRVRENLLECKQGLVRPSTTATEHKRC